MPDTCDPFALTIAPTAQRPLAGHTILVVEDSRFASEALRLLCLRSGARIRRADSLTAARRHLRVYRPTAVIVDLGLPDGSGIDLIAELALATPRVAALIGTSGDPDAGHAARAAGATGFLCKPIDSLAVFQQTVLAALPRDLQPPGPRVLSDERVAPDPIALRDDLLQADRLLSDGAPPDYLAQFVGGLALTARDRALHEAASTVTAQGRSPAAADLARLAGLVRARLGDAAATL